MARAYPGDTFRAMSRAICLALVCGLAAHAHASPRSDPTSGRAVFTGAATPGAPSLELNPAALGLGNDATEYYAAAIALIDHYSVARDGHARADDTEIGPGGVFAVILKLKDRATLGFQLHAGPAEVFPAGVDDWRYHTLGGGQRRYGGTVGGSIKLTSELSFGASLALESTYLRLRYARDTALAAGADPARGVGSDCGGAPCGIENPLATERYDVDVSSAWFSASDALRPSFGIVYEVTRGVFVGLSYHMPPGLAVQNALTGTMTVRQAPRDGGGLVHGRSTVYLSQPSSADAEVRAQLPDNLDLHVGMRWEDLSRLSGYDVRGYAPGFTAEGIPEWTERPRGFHDSFAMWAGVEQSDAHTDALVRLGGRLGFETASLRGSRTNPLTIAPASVSASVGLQLRLAPNVHVQATYGLQYFVPVHVARSAFDPQDQLECMASAYDYSTDACAAVRNGYAIPSAAGDYDRMQHALRLALRYEY
jgi:hypothetical protein